MATSATDPGSVQTELKVRIEGMLAGLGGGAQLVKERSLKGAKVLRQIWQAGGQQHAYVLKLFTAERSQVERLAIERWLPALGMASVAPRLLSVLVATDPQWVWHIYEDLGDGTLDASAPSGLRLPGKRDRGFLSGMDGAVDEARLEAALASLAELHETSAGHALLGECRYWAADLGSHFLSTSVREAIAALAALQPSRIALSQAELRTRDALLAVLMRLGEDIPRRSAELEAYGGPDCLLHGDFGVSNAIICRNDDRLGVRLIDWDHAGVGPACYDLSTILLQLPASQRAWALKAYCRSRNAPLGGWPPPEAWNALFDTAERSRLANSVIWPALWAVDGESQSAFEDLSAMLSWFEALPAVLENPRRKELLSRVHEPG